MILHFFIEKISFHISKVFCSFLSFFSFFGHLNFYISYIYVVNKHFGKCPARSFCPPAEVEVYISGMWQTAIQEQAFKTVLLKVEWPFIQQSYSAPQQTVGAVCTLLVFTVSRL